MTELIKPDDTLAEALLGNVRELKKEREGTDDLDRHREINEEIERIRVQIDVLLTVRMKEKGKSWIESNSGVIIVHSEKTAKEYEKFLESKSNNPYPLTDK